MIFCARCHRKYQKFRWWVWRLDLQCSITQTSHSRAISSIICGHRRQQIRIAASICPYRGRFIHMLILAGWTAAVFCIWLPVAAWTEAAWGAAGFDIASVLLLLLAQRSGRHIPAGLFLVRLMAAVFVWQLLFDVLGSLFGLVSWACLQLMVDYCRPFQGKRIVDYCHYCQEGLELGGADAIHLAALLFGSESSRKTE